MRYLILAAGAGLRMRGAAGGTPKCLIELGGETLIGRLLRQLRELDRDADIRVVIGYRRAEIAPHLDGCEVVVNRAWSSRGINGSLWAARASFDRAVTILHADLAFADDALGRIVDAGGASWLACDSSVRRRWEINVTVREGRIAQFGERYNGYTGVYVGALGLAAEAAARFAATLDRRMRRRDVPIPPYYFFLVRGLRQRHGVRFAAVDLAGCRWHEIDRPDDIAAARARIAGESDRVASADVALR